MKATILAASAAIASACCLPSSSGERANVRLLRLCFALQAQATNGCTAAAAGSLPAKRLPAASKSGSPDRKAQSALRSAPPQFHPLTSLGLLRQLICRQQVGCILHIDQRHLARLVLPAFVQA